MAAFPSDAHLCAWSGLAPGNNESAGKRLSGKIRKGNQSLKTGLVQAAHAAVRSKDTHLSALYRRISARRGVKKAIIAVAHSILKAIIAVAHSILKAIYHMLVRETSYIELGGDYYDNAYIELGGDYYDKLTPRRTAPRLIKRLQEMGYTVTKPQANAVAA